VNVLHVFGGEWGGVEKLTMVWSDTVSVVKEVSVKYSFFHLVS
jgi:hypothetical protein